MPDTNARVAAGDSMEDVGSRTLAFEVHVEIVQVIAQVRHENILHTRRQAQTILAYTVEHDRGPCLISFVLCRITQGL